MQISVCVCCVSVRVCVFYDTLLIQDALLGNGDNTASKTMESMEIAGGGVGFSTQTHQIWNKQDTIPEDPLLAETHYTEVIHIMYICIT